MNSSSEYKEKEHVRTFSVSISAEEMPPSFEKAEKSLLKHVKLKGFRKGKVPKDLISNSLEPEDVRIEALKIAVGEAFEASLKQENILHFVGDPQFHVRAEDFKKDKDFSFTFSIILPAEVVLGDYKTLTLTPPEITISDEDIAKEREEFEKFLGDLDHRQDQQHGGVPTLGQSFLDLLRKYTSLTSLEEFDKSAKNALYNRRVRETLAAFGEQVLDAVAKQATMRFSPVLIEAELDESIKRLESRLVQHKSTLEAFLKEQNLDMAGFREQQWASAERGVKARLILDKFVEQEKLTVSDGDIEVEKKIILTPFHGQDKKLTAEGKELSKTLASEEGKAYIARTILRDKAMNTLLQQFVPAEYGKGEQDVAKSSLVLPDQQSAAGSFIVPPQI